MERLSGGTQQSKGAYKRRIEGWPKDIDDDVNRFINQQTDGESSLLLAYMVKGHLGP